MLDLFSSQSNATDKRQSVTDQGILLGKNATLGGINLTSGKNSPLTLVLGTDALQTPAVSGTTSPQTQNVNTVDSSINWTKVLTWAGIGLGAYLVLGFFFKD